jgi:hypothetical protein
MKTPAIIASLTVAGSIAFAAGQRITDAERHPVSPSQVNAIVSPFNCAPTAVAWFEPRLQSLNVICSAIGRQALYSADVNADGLVDYFHAEEGTVVLVENGVPLSNPARGLFHSTTTRLGGGVAFNLVQVLGFNQDVGTRLIEANPGLSNAWIDYFSSASSPNDRTSGWRDCDEDGDLDLVVTVRLFFGSGSMEYRPMWFENIGYEKPAPPIAADINGDGRVDGADLGLLLVAWGPTP